MLNTPYDDEVPGRGNKATPARGRARPAFVLALVVILLIIGSTAKESAAFVGALLLYLAENAPARTKVEFTRFLVGLTEPFFGCRTCQA